MSRVRLKKIEGLNCTLVKTPRRIFKLFPKLNQIKYLFSSNYLISTFSQPLTGKKESTDEFKFRPVLFLKINKNLSLITYLVFSYKNLYV